MFDLLLDWGAVLLPILLSLVGVFVSLETPNWETRRTRVAWRIGLVVFGILASVVTLLQQKNARLETDTIKSLLGSIASALKIDPNTSAPNLTAEILKRLESTEKRVERLANPPRDNNTLYSDGMPLAQVAGIAVPNNNVVTFQAITADREIDFSKEMEFQKARVLCAPSGSSGYAGTGARVAYSYFDVHCTIIGPRKGI